MRKYLQKVNCNKSHEHKSNKGKSIFTDKAIKISLLKHLKHPI